MPAERAAPGPSRRTLTAVAAPPSLDAVHDLLEALWRSGPQIGERDRQAFETGVAEVAANLVEHAAGATFTLSVTADAQLLEASFQDDGPPVAPGDAAAEWPADLMAESGRGLALAQALCDTVRYQRDASGNHWTVRLSRSDRAG